MFTHIIFRSNTVPVQLEWWIQINTSIFSSGTNLFIVYHTCLQLTHKHGAIGVYDIVLRCKDISINVPFVTVTNGQHFITYN